MIPLKLVLVEWLDSERGDGWVRVQDVAETAKPHRSVGWVVIENEDVIVVAPHHSPETSDADEQISGHMKIPKCAVLKVTELGATVAELRQAFVKGATWQDRSGGKGDAENVAGLCYPDGGQG